MRGTYLDHDTTKPTRSDVVQAMPPCSKEVTDHLQNPCNAGAIENPEDVGHLGNPVCRDIIEHCLEIEDGLIAVEHRESKHRPSA
jgi:hypothetical protein